MESGTIKTLVAERGFGFIESLHGEVFFHCSSVASGVFDTLREGQAVSFVAVEGQVGKRPRAVNVTLELQPTPWPDQAHARDEVHH